MKNFLVIGLIALCGALGYFLQPPAASVDMPVVPQETLGAPTQVYFRTILPITTTNTIGNASNTWNNVFATGVTSTFATSTYLNLTSVAACTGGSALQVNATGLVTCGSISVSSPFGKTLEIVNGALAPTTSPMGIMFSASSSFGGLVTFSQGLLSIASSTFQNGLNVNGVLNASNTLLVQNLVGYASSSFQNDLIVSRYLGVSSTFGVSGLATLSSGFLSLASSSVNNDFHVARNLMVSSSLLVSGQSLFYNGLIGITSSSFGNDLLVSRTLGVSSTFNATGLATFFGGFIAPVSSTVSGNFTAGNLMTSGTLAMGKNGYQKAGGELRITGTIPSATTSDKFIIFEAERNTTLRGFKARVGCPNGCQGGAGYKLNFRHGTSFVPASTTANGVFSNDIYVYSSTTAQSFCNVNALDSACTFNPTFDDVTLAAGEALWIVVSSTAGSTSSTAATDLSFTWLYDEQ